MTVDWEREGHRLEDRGHDIRYRPRTARDGEWFLEAECACGWVKPFDPIDGWVSEAVLATASVRHRMWQEPDVTKGYVEEGK